MEVEPITTETAKMQLIPELKYTRSKKALDATLVISTTIAIPAFRTFEATVSSKLIPAEDEVILITPMPEIRCVIAPSVILPGRVPKELLLIFYNLANQTLRLDGNKPIAIVKVLSLAPPLKEVAAKPQNKDE